MATRVCPPVRSATVSPLRPVEPTQYTSAGYAKVMAEHGILPSVDRTGICYDNAAADPYQRDPEERTREPQGLPDQDPPESGT